ncbi:hypothetical protein ACRRTK_007786 [Alexandromys fortis]
MSERSDQSVLVCEIIFMAMVSLLPGFCVALALMEHALCIGLAPASGVLKFHWAFLLSFLRLDLK